LGKPSFFQITAFFQQIIATFVKEKPVGKKKMSISVIYNSQMLLEKIVI
jgi:hypothetical protein